MTTLTRRQLWRRALVLPLLATRAHSACAEDAGLYPFKDDEGRPVFNYRLPSDLSVDQMPGVVWAGAKSATAVLVEFFDYNCPYCRTAAGQLAELLQGDAALRLGLVNNPILGVGSVQAAKVQQAVLRDFGPAKAYAFHLALLSAHRPVDGPFALETAAGLGMDAKKIEGSGNLPQVGAVLTRQAHLALALGFDATPSFVVGDVGVPGYPGIGAIRRAVAAARSCGKLVC